MRKIILFYCLLLTSFAFAQIPNIEVKDMKNHPVIIQEVFFETQIFGNLAETKATYVFKNNGSRDLEGTLTFPLPDGVFVSGYALDINGQLREAVPVPKEKAKEVFESIARKNVDPGILEKVMGNNFRTRIYPMPANGKRTIQIIFKQELKVLTNESQFELSFANGTKFKDFHLKTIVNNKGKTPAIIENPDGSFVFENKDSQWMAEIHKTDFTPNTNLKISIPNTPISNVILQRKEDVKYYFAANVVTNFPFNNKPNSSKVGIIWDNSLSGSKRNVEADLQFLALFFKDNPNVNIQFCLLNITFENTTEFNISNGDWSALREKIITLKYDGATDFNALKELDSVDEYLLFSDGMSNFGDLSLSFKKPLSSITSSPTSDFNLLKFMAYGSGGNFINLNEVNSVQGFKIYKKQPLKFLGFKEKLIVEEVYPPIGSVV
ncbi:VIT domain-containing protein, partial [Flavobacterium sp.]|uniref:VIT domain-containing protein n=1 Tax=Flavobacterium sp. TaxID=239 RepID=UPI003C4555CD